MSKHACICGVRVHFLLVTCVFHFYLSHVCFVSHGKDVLVIQNMTRCVDLYVHTKKEYMCQCIHMCTYIYISPHICAYRYNINMDMYTCVYMYIHTRQNEYMYIMIHTYEYIYMCGFSVRVWVGERICVAIRYSHNLLTQKKSWKSCENMISGSQ